MDENDRYDLAEILQDRIVMYAYEHPFSDEEVDAWLQNQRRRYREDGFGLWAVIRLCDGAFLGQAGLTVQFVEGVRMIEIGYLFKQKVWKNGYATEAARACKEYAFSHLNKKRVVSIIREGNESSKQVAIRNGMRPVANIIKHYYGMDMPHIVYAADREE